MTEPLPAPPATAPVPPRSRTAAHIAGLALALLGGPLAFAALALAATREIPLHPEMTSLMWPAVALAAVLTFATTWIGVRSSAGAAVGGAIWLVAGLVSEIAPGIARWLGDLVPENFHGIPARAGADLLLSGGGCLAVGATMLGAAVATTFARRRGRALEQVEQEHVVTGDVTVPPRSRITAHIASPIIALVFTLAAIALLNGSVTEVAGGGRASGLGVAVLVVVTLVPAATGLMSSLGPGVAGLAWLAATLHVLLSGTQDAPWTLARPLADGLITGDPTTAVAGYSTGLTLVLGLALVGAALGAHYARRDGRAGERSEQRLRRRDRTT